MDANFTNKGWKFPIEPDPSTGRIKMVFGEDDIQESIRIILFTNTGERIMEPNFGSNVRKYIFAPSTGTTYGMLGDEIQNSITQWEPRVKDVSVNIRSQKGDTDKVYVDVHCTVVRTDTNLDLVYNLDLNI